MGTEYSIGEVVDINFGIGGRLYGYVSGVSFEEGKIKYNVVIKVGSIEDDLFTEVKDIDSKFVKKSED
jgi:hypothetical protein